MTIDARYYQIFTLTVVLFCGVYFYDFEVKNISVLVVILSALATQYVFSKIYFLKYDYKSPTITALSLCILVRTDYLLVAALTACFAISSKFIFRVNDRHCFNPANIAIVLSLLLSDYSWVSPGQWGVALYFNFLLLVFAGMVLFKSRTYDVSLMFILSYAGIIFLRAYWLGDPVEIPLKQLQNGAFLIFTFFMISDPKTVPDSFCGRSLFAFVCALIATYIQFILFIPYGLFYSLALVTPFVFLFNLLFPGKKFNWKNA